MNSYSQVLPWIWIAFQKWQPVITTENDVASLFWPFDLPDRQGLTVRASTFNQAIAFISNLET